MDERPSLSLCVSVSGQRGISYHLNASTVTKLVLGGRCVFSDTNEVMVDSYVAVMDCSYKTDYESGWWVS
jgi:hypothetical protein